jgi:hypothetical protein
MDQALSLFLTQFFSEIFEINEHENHIQTGLLNGLLCLENLTIKKHLFDNEKAPITLCHGSIGKIEIKFPWKNLGNEPIQIILENVFILCKPQYKRDTMEMKLQREYRHKCAVLSALDAYATASTTVAETRTDMKTKTKNSTFQYFTRFFAEKILRSILNNFEIQIKNLHFRYEDQISCANEFTIGFTLEKFHLESMKQSSIISSFGLLFSLFSSSNTQPIYQRCSIDSFSVYMNQLTSPPSLTPIAGSSSSSTAAAEAASAGMTGIGIGSYSFLDKPTREIVQLMARSIPTRYRNESSSESVVTHSKHDYLIHPFHTFCQIEISLGTYDDNGTLLTHDIQVRTCV